MDMYPIPMGIQSLKDEYSQVSPQNLINLYPVPTPQSKQPIALKQSPGLSLFANVGAAHRGAFKLDGKRYVVSGTSLYKESPLGTFTSVGTIPGSGPVGMAANDRELGPQLMIVNGTETGYVYSESAGLSSVTLTGPAYTVVYQDGYFVFDWAGTGKWFISNVNNGLQFDSTETGASNSRPDQVLAVISKKQKIWICGEESFEVYINDPSGNIDFPFIKIAEVTTDDVGLGNRNTLIYDDNALYLIGSDKLPYRTRDYNLEMIGNDDINEVLEDIELSQLSAFGFKWRSHFFYQICLPNGIGYRYDARTGLWHTVRGWSSGCSRYPGDSYHYFNGRHYMGDSRNGNIYEVNAKTLTNNSSLIRREMVTPFYHDNGKQFSVKRVRADFKHGVGNSNAPTPVVLLEWTEDGENWSDPIPGFLGETGKQFTRVWWDSLGCHDQIAYKIWWTDQVDTTLMGLYGA